MALRSACITCVSLALIGGVAPPAQAQPEPVGPPFDAAAVETNIREALASRIDTAGVGVGTIVGVLTPEGRRYITHGRTEKSGGVEPDANTVFEIGSITKVFTALLLADMVERDEVALDDEIARYLPADVRVPARNGKAITFVDLATHTSGLPRLPTNLQALDLIDPYAAYGPAQLHEFLSGYELPRDPGEKWEYSNVGAGLLGYVLARRAGMSYEALLRARILAPLGMHDTTITLSPEQRARMATGHDLAMSPTGPWAFDALAGAGAL